MKKVASEFNEFDSLVNFLTDFRLKLNFENNPSCKDIKSHENSNRNEMRHYLSHLTFYNWN